MGSLPNACDLVMAHRAACHFTSEMSVTANLVMKIEREMLSTSYSKTGAIILADNKITGPVTTIDYLEIDHQQSE